MTISNGEGGFVDSGGAGVLGRANSALSYILSP